MSQFQIQGKGLQAGLSGFCMHNPQSTPLKVPLEGREAQSPWHQPPISDVKSGLSKEHGRVRKVTLLTPLLLGSWFPACVSHFTGALWGWQVPISPSKLLLLPLRHCLWPSVPPSPVRLGPAWSGGHFISPPSQPLPDHSWLHLCPSTLKCYVAFCQCIRTPAK